MATSLQANIDFPATPDRTFVMFTSVSYAELKCKSASDATFGIENVDQTIDVTISRRFNNIPETFKKFVGESFQLQEHQSWKKDAEGNHYANVTITVQDKPVTVIGTIRLTPQGDGTRLVFDAQVSVAIPLFGGMAEGFIRDQLHEILNDEQTIGLQWLAQNY